MFQSPVCQLPSMAQFSKAMRMPLSAARLARSDHTSLYRGRLSVSGLLRMRPVKPATQVAPKWWALSMQSFQPCRVWRSISWSSSGLPNMPMVEMVMSRSPMASSDRLPSSARSCPLVVCQKKGSKLSNPRSAISPIRSAALPADALIMVPIRMDLAGSLTKWSFR
ncbi:hypothetical protein D3C87_1444640 [compost metagenome]